MPKIRKLEIFELAKRFSPVAWQHINLVGKFEFCLKQKDVDLKGIIEELLTNPDIGILSVSQ